MRVVNLSGGFAGAQLNTAISGRRTARPPLFHPFHTHSAVVPPGSFLRLPTPRRPPTLIYVCIPSATFISPTFWTHDVHWCSAGLNLDSGIAGDSTSGIERGPKCATPLNFSCNYTARLDPGFSVYHARSKPLPNDVKCTANLLITASIFPDLICFCPRNKTRQTDLAMLIDPVE